MSSILGKNIWSTGPFFWTDRWNCIRNTHQTKHKVNLTKQNFPRKYQPTSNQTLPNTKYQIPNTNLLPSYLPNTLGKVRIPRIHLHNKYEWREYSPVFKIVKPSSYLLWSPYSCDYLITKFHWFLKSKKKRILIFWKNHVSIYFPFI